jgi:hypothetical protein
MPSWHLQFEDSAFVYRQGFSLSALVWQRIVFIKKKERIVKKMFLLGAVLAASTLTSAIADNARIDITCKDRTQSIKQVQSSGHNYNHSWNKQNPFAGRSLEAKVGPEWTEMTATLTPEADGDWIISLKGQWKRDKDKNMVPVEVYYDKLSVTGAELKNGSFETAQAKKNLPANWWASKAFVTDNRYILDPANAKDGERFVKVWHNRALSQQIKVTAGQPVTLSVFVKQAN